jgi:hypothetical protein
MPGQVFTTYSFLDNQIALISPSVSFDIGSAGVSDDAFRVANVGPKTTMTIGADGDGMHNLIASNAARAEVSFLKEGPGNALMSALYNFQSASSANTGNISITVQNNVTGDSIALAGGAIEKQADISYTREGASVVWSFNFISRRDFLGNGLNTRAEIVAVV